VDFHIYTTEGVYTEDRLSLQWNASAGLVDVTEFGSTPWGGAFGGDVDFSGELDSFAGYKGKIKNFQRIEIDITENSQFYHEINYISLQTKEKANIRRRNLTLN
jgi:hypothetical protein